jgi:hypothetical protein
MTIGKIAYLTSPAEGRYLLNFQAFGSEELIQIEVAPESFRNILSDGVRLMLHSSFHRVPVTTREILQDGPLTQSV